MDNENLWHLRNQIFEDLSHEDVLKCRRVSKYWNESLRRMSAVKFIEEFGERDVESTNQKVSTIFPGWKKTVKKYCVQASNEDLEKVKDSLKNLAGGKGQCCLYPVHEACWHGQTDIAKLMIQSSFKDYLNVQDDNCGRTAFMHACTHGGKETAQMIIENSKEFGINLNARSDIDDGLYTAWHFACCNGQTETVQLIIQNSKEFCIDLNAVSYYQGTAWHCVIRDGDTEIAQLIMQNSKEFDIDLNAKDNTGSTAWHVVCDQGKTEMVQFILQNSKEFGINLNAKSNSGRTALHMACGYGKTETVQMILKNWKEFGIDIKAQDNAGRTALDLLNEEEGGRWYGNRGNPQIKKAYDQIRPMLEKEYSQIDVTESVQSLNLD